MAAGWRAAAEAAGAAGGDAGAGAATAGLAAGVGLATAGLPAEGAAAAAGLFITAATLGADAACIGFDGAAGAGAGFVVAGAAGRSIVLPWTGEVGLPGPCCCGPVAGAADGRTAGDAANGGAEAGWLSAGFGAAVTGGTVAAAPPVLLLVGVPVPAGAACIGEGCEAVEVAGAGADAGFAAAAEAGGLPADAGEPASTGLVFVDDAAVPGALLPCIDCDEAAA